MIPAAFGAIVAAVRSLDGRLDPETLRQLTPEDLADAWRAANELCRAADDLHQKLRDAYVDLILRASNPKGTG